MSFVQDSTAPTENKQITAPEKAVASEPAVTQSPAAEVASEAKSETQPETKAEAKPNSITITKSETVTKPVDSNPSGPLSFLMWLPLFAAMALWLFLRGRNQAAQRARSEALLATASKKAKKSARAQQAEFRAEQPSDSTSKVSGERSKGNSKKNKKDKLQQKKKQKSNSGAGVSKSATLATTSAVSTIAANPTPRATESPKSTATSLPAVATIESLSTQQKPSAPSAKAIFEPLRKVTAPVRVESETEDIDTEDEEEFVPVRRSRPSPPPAVISTPAKVSSGRFEKLNVPAANAGLGASSANRWPAEAARAVTPVQTSEKSTAPRSNNSDAKPASVAQAPITARGLGAFVKVAKSTDGNQPATASETQSESSGS